MTVTAPTSCHWEQARVDIVKVPAGSRAGEFGPKQTKASVEHVLVLLRSGAEDRLQLEQADETQPDYKELRSAAYTLLFAPDGHALALSTDGGKTGKYVALDAGDAPLYCRHSAFPLSGADPFQAAPTTRSLVLEVLSSSTRPGAATGKNHADVFTDETGDQRLDDQRFSAGPGGADLRFPQELRGALRWALLHPDDEAARLAVADALFRPGRQLARELSRTTEAAGHLAAAHADVRGKLLAQLPGELYDRAALALAQTSAADAQDALAAALLAAFTAPPSDQGADRIALLAYALARTTIARGQASLPAMSAIRTVARTASPCPPRRDVTSKEAVSGRGQASRRFMIQALAALGTPDAKEVLAELAQGPCKAYNDDQTTGTSTVLREDQPLPRWQPGLKGYAEELERDQGGGIRLDLACFARAALGK